MKTKILFVDDEPLILEALQRMLRQHRGEWEMSFCEGGVQALAAMEREPFDVVVSDMRMPGMNGAQLLAEIMRLYPKTVRLILSGHADQEPILQCIGSAHQYLSKPCEPEALRSVIRRATSLANSLENERVKELVANMGDLPTIPKLYSELVGALNDPDTMLDDVGRVVERDPVITAKLLKLVNSAFFGLRRQVASPAEAVNYLGIDTIKSLVLTTATFQKYDSVSFNGLSLEALWSHSFDTAACAKLIARSESAGEKIAEESFVAGLLHDVGKLILAANFRDRYSQVLEAGAARGDLISAELDGFGTTHAAVGGYLLGLWGLPVPVVEAIALHHAPASTFDKVFTPLTAVHAANAIIQSKPEGLASPESSSLLDMSYLAGLGLDHRVAVWHQEFFNQQRDNAA